MADTKNLNDLKLYGLALAAIPTKEDEDKLKIVCHPICVTGGRREEFKIVDDEKLKPFTKVIDFKDVKQVAEGLIKATQMVSELTKRQTESLKQHGLEYRPVVLEIGQDSQNPVYDNALSIPLFGELFSPDRHDVSEWITSDQMSDLAAQMIKANEQRIEDAKKRGDTAAQANEEKMLAWFKESMRIDQEARDKYGRDKLAVIEAKHLKHNARSKRINSISDMREQLLHDPTYAPQLREAYAELEALLKDKCTLSWGSFTRGGGIDENSLEPTNNDRILIELKKRLDAGDIAALEELKCLAREEGLETAKSVNHNRWTFASLGPKNYHKDMGLQEKLPRFGAFYAWDPSIRKTFYDSYKRNLNIKVSRHYKLAIDEPMPFFTDPCADMVVDQFQIIKNEMDPNAAVDQKDWRLKISDSVRNSIGGPA